MNDCIFCKIARGEIPHGRIYEDKDVVAFLDISPASKKGGHTLVIPKKHYATFEEISKSDLAALIQAIQKVGTALKKYFNCDYNLLLNNGKTAGQFVMHSHFHIIPRFEADGIEIGKWKSGKYKAGELEALAEKIKKLL